MPSGCVYFPDDAAQLRLPMGCDNLPLNSWACRLSVDFIGFDVLGKSRWRTDAGLPEMTKHISWEVMLTFGFIIPFTGIFTGETTGIKECIVQMLQPILAGMPPIVFLAMTLLIATVLTNVANNMVVGAVFATLIFAIAMGIMGMEVTPMIAVLIVCCNLALATPAASPTAAMCFSNSKWCKAGDLYKYGWLTVLLGFVFTAVVGLAWAFIVY